MIIITYSSSVVSACKKHEIGLKSSVYEINKLKINKENLTGLNFKTFIYGILFLSM